MMSAGAIGEASSLLPPRFKVGQQSELLLLHRVGTAQALLTAIRALQDVGDLRTLAERAAGGALRMIQASASAAYIESPNGE
ncbi:MAG: hypothetical protein ACJ79H_11315, partial [Myxococcales bacterium]